MKTYINIIKEKVNIILVVLLTFSAIVQVQAQLEEVKFQMKYNPATCNYDCNLIIVQGQAVSILERIQSGHQFSIVVPTGSVINQVNRYMPLQNNGYYNGNNAANWHVGNSVISPAVTPEFDYHSLSCPLSPMSHYNNIYAGDTILLFSLDITTPTACTDGVRIYENGTDPDSGEEGMNGGDFSCGFTAISSPQLYTGNAPQLQFPNVVVTNSDDNSEGCIRYVIANYCCVDTIFFAPALNNIPVLLESEVVINKNIVIKGNGPDQTYLDGASLNRIFSIASGKTISLIDLTLQNASELLNGGAILNNGTVICDNVVLKDNMEGNFPKAITNNGSLIIAGTTLVSP